MINRKIRSKAKAARLKPRRVVSMDNYRYGIIDLETGKFIVGELKL